MSRFRRSCSREARGVKGIAARHNRRGEDCHFVPGMMKVDARDIKSAADVEPIRGTDDALVTKEEDLAPCEGVDPT